MTEELNQQEASSEEQGQLPPKKKTLTYEEYKALRAQRIAKIMKFKENLSALPNSIVLMPHTEEGHILCYMAFWTEKLMWMMRRKLGVIVRPERLTEYSSRIKEAISKLYTLSGISEYSLEAFYTDDKVRAANMRRSWVLAPRTPEGKYVALAVRVLDPMMIQLRATGNSDEVVRRVSEVAKALIDLNRILRNLSSELLALVPGPERDEVRYRTPRFVKKVLRLAKLEQEGGDNEDNSDNGAGEVY